MSILKGKLETEPHRPMMAWLRLEHERPEPGSVLAKAEASAKMYKRHSG